jgi:hypothetical protein
MELADNQLVPIQLLMGWLPKVAVKDARLYVAGLADKHCQSMRDSGYLLLPFDNGWAYEVQEGGPGKAYLPAILKVFAEAYYYYDGSGNNCSRLSIGCFGWNIEAVRNKSRN